MIIRFLIISFLFFSLTPSAKADSSSQSWTVVNLDMPIFQDTSQYRLFLETEPRYNLSESRTERVFLSTGLGYRVDANLSFWLGYMWNTSGYRIEDERVDEHRISPQMNYIHTKKDFTFIHRVRLENRIIEDDNRFSQRLRYLLRLSHPILTSGEQTYGITVFNEIMYNLNSAEPIVSTGWNRNRTFVGPYLTYQKLRLEIGYLYEIIKFEGEWDRDIHAIRTSINFIF